MKKLLAMLLVLVISVSICSTAFAQAIIGFEDQNTYGKQVASNYYYRKARITADNTVAKFGNYSAKISSAKHYDGELGDYVPAFKARFSVSKMGIEDESFFDAWFYFPESCNVESITITAVDKAGEDLFLIDSIDVEDYDKWVSLYEYWGETFNQDNAGIVDICYLQFDGTAVDPEQEVVFYVDNLFFGTEAEFETYMQNPDAAVPVVDGNGDSTTDVNPTDAPDADDKGSEKENDDMLMWYIVGGVVGVALVAAVVVVVVAKKKK